MRAHPLTAILLCSLWVAPAQAAPRPDDHLYLRTERDLITEYGWSRHGRWRRPWPRARHWIAEHQYITLGPEPISSTRFLSLIASSHADPGLMQAIGAREADRDHWGLAALCSVAVLTAGVVLGASENASSTQDAIATGLTATGLGASLVTGAVWSAKASQPTFSLDEARAAIDSYNRALEAMQHASL